MELFTPAWKSKNEKKALPAVEKITDQQKLIKIAKEANSWIVRKAAVEKLTDQNALIDVAINDKDTDVRKAAITKLDDDHLIALFEERISTIRRSNKHFIEEILFVCYQTERFTKASLLTRLIKISEELIKAPQYADYAYGSEELDEPHFESYHADQIEPPKMTMKSIRMSAVEKLIDESAFADIAKNDGNSHVRIVAIKTITDKRALIDIAKYDDDSDIREAAIEKLKTLID
jgi:hypothetical protein